MLETLRVKESELLVKVKELNNEVIGTVHNWIESISGIKVALSRAYLRPCNSLYKKGKSAVGLEYLEVDIINEDGKEVFGTDITISWYGDVITVNSGSCGEFVVLGEQRDHDKYQVLKYKLLGILMQYTEELNTLLNSFDYSVIKEYHDVHYEIGRLEWEEKQHQIAVERKMLIDSIKLSNVYFDHDQSNKKTITKITDKRVYFTITYNSGYEIIDKYYSKEDVIYNLKHKVWELM